MEEVVYLNTAYISPLSFTVLNAIRAGSAIESRPWEIIPKVHFFDFIDEIKGDFAKLFNVKSKNVALIPSASYGLSTAAINIVINPGQKIILLNDQFPSNVYPWKRLALRNDCSIKFVEGIAGESLTNSILKEMDENCALVAVPNATWTSGNIIDLFALRKRSNEIKSYFTVKL